MVAFAEWVAAIAQGHVGLDDASLRSLVGQGDPPVGAAERLGHIYEQHLAASHGAARKAMGVYYTPAPVVDHIVGHALSRTQAGRVVDPACGAGSFLLSAFDRLAGRHEPAGRTRILLDHIFGVDLDPPAVAITKLSLWLRLMEGGCSVDQLPNLDRNIRCGDALGRSFDWAAEFPAATKAGGFDAVVGNPPYVSYGLRDAGKLSELDKDYYRVRYVHSAEYKISIYALFIQLGIELLREGGVCSYIVPDSFLLGRYFSKLRRYVLDTCRVDRLVLLQARVFAGATVGRSVILHLTRSPGAEARRTHEVTAVRCDRVVQLQGGGETFRYPQAYFESLPLSRFRLFFSAGAKALADRVESGPAVSLERLLTLSSGLIGKQGKESITAPESRGPEWKPGLLSGEEITRYAVRWQGGYIRQDPVWLKSGFRDARYHEPKLLCRQTGDRLIWAYDDQGLLCLNNLHVGNMRGETVHPFYLLGILNSRLMSAYYQTIALEAGRVLAQTDIETLNGLPVRMPEPGLHDDVVQLVEQMIAGSGDPVDLDHQIDELVDSLYGVGSG